MYVQSMPLHAPFGFTQWMDMRVDGFPCWFGGPSSRDRCCPALLAVLVLLFLDDLRVANENLYAIRRQFRMKKTLHQLRCIMF